MIDPIPKVEHKIPSNRSFGFLMAFAALVCSVWSYSESRLDLSIPAAYGAGVVLFLAIFIPKALYPFNRAWYVLGVLIGNVVSPAVLGVLFFFVITPIAVVTRIFGRDPLRLKKMPYQKTFWIERTPTSNLADSFKNQF